MTRKYYQILGISETATLEEIKKSYRKLAQQWHPDKWNTKSLSEREVANEKMQELNKAYEILSDEDKRKRYDLGETNFSYDTSESFDWQSYYDTERAKLNTEAEKIRFQLEAVARREVINTIGFEFDIASGVFPRRLDSKLWEPYSRWGEKVLDLEVFFTVDGRLDKINSPLYKFMNEMIAAIRKRKEELKNGINNPQVDRARIEAIQSIERELQTRNLKVENLVVEYRNYQEQINGLPKVWQINSYRDKVKESIRRNSREKGDDKQDNRINNLKEKFSQPPSDTSEKEWDKEKESLLKEIQELKEKNIDKEELNKRFNGLEMLIRELKEEIKELRNEIQELKKENNDDPNALSYVAKKESDLRVKQLRLDQLLSVVEVNNDYKTPKNNNFPIIPIVGVISVIFLLGLIIRQVRKDKIKK